LEQTNQYLKSYQFEGVLLLILLLRLFYPCLVLLGEKLSLNI